jgi:3-deoxy-manno-octulosonate cytidylyltransferase (CMP-KDO synthetase)
MARKGAVVIPARMASTRFPGKPLAIIRGRPMIQHVYERCVSAVGRHNVIVATDHKEIMSRVEGFGGQSILTPSDCLTGTDRVACVAEALSLDFVVNVQGDEPLVNPEDVLAVYNAIGSNGEFVINCYGDLEEFEFGLCSVPKVVVSENEKLLYISRGGLPYDKHGNSFAKFKQICIYGYSREHLNFFSQRSGKSSNEAVEDIEILRFLDHDIPVKMLKLRRGSVCVDYPSDLSRVEDILANCG